MCSHGLGVKRATNSSICLYIMGHGTKEDGKERCSKNSDDLLKPDSIQLMDYIARMTTRKDWWIGYENIYGIPHDIFI